MTGSPGSAIMTRYYIHLSDGRELIDTEGEHHADLEGARLAAILTMSEVLPARASSLWDNGSLTVTLVEDGGEEV
ncbi:MAG: hypothetical protein EOP94_03895, partial [Zymomonas sp.]